MCATRDDGIASNTLPSLAIAGVLGPTGLFYFHKSGEFSFFLRSKLSCQTGSQRTGSVLLAVIGLVLLYPSATYHSCNIGEPRYSTTCNNVTQQFITATPTFRCLGWQVPGSSWVPSEFGCHSSVCVAMKPDIKSKKLKTVNVGMVCRPNRKQHVQLVRNIRIMVHGF